MNSMAFFRYFQIPLYGFDEYANHILLSGAACVTVGTINFYFKTLKPILINRRARKLSGLIDLGLVTPVTKKIRRDDGTYIEKVVNFKFPKIKKFDGGVRIKFKTDKATKDFIEKSLDVLSNCFETKFFEVEEIDNKYFALYEDRLPSSTEMIPNPKFHSMYLGRDNRNQPIIIDTREDFSFFVGAKTGDGKTVTIIAMIYSWLRSVNFKSDIAIFDTKGADYRPLIKNAGAKFFDMNSLEGIKAATDYLVSINAQRIQCKKILENHDLVNYEDARGKGISLPLRRTIFIFDEAGRYLKISGATDEIKEAKKYFIEIVEGMLAEFRSSGCPIIISTQRVQKDEMKIPFDNFKCQLFANLSKEMDSKYRDGNFHSLILGQGQWTISDSKRSATRIRTMYLPKAFDKPLAKEDPMIENEDPHIPETSIFHMLRRAEVAENLHHLKSPNSEKYLSAKSYFINLKSSDFQEIIAQMKRFSEFKDDIPAILDLLLLKGGEAEPLMRPEESLSHQIPSKPNNQDATRGNEVNVQLISYADSEYKILKTNVPSKLKYADSHLILTIQDSSGNEFEILIPVDKKDDHEWIMKKIFNSRITK